MEHERATSPLMCTVQAPHCATPHPYLVPVRPICSRMTHKSGVSASACTSRTFPFTFNLAIDRVLSVGTAWSSISSAWYNAVPSNASVNFANRPDASHVYGPEGACFHRDVFARAIGVGMTRRCRSGLLPDILLGVATLIVPALLLILAYASPPDPTWISGVYDDGDGD